MNGIVDGNLKTILISMPFSTVGMPSLQLGLLSAIGKAHGFEVDTLHLNLDFAARVGGDLYEVLCLKRVPELGNWLFSMEAFRDEAPDQDGRLPYDFSHAVDFLSDFNLDVDGFHRLRNETAPEFLAHAETRSTGHSTTLSDLPARSNRTSRL